jgi:hypothetical protein
MAEKNDVMKELLEECDKLLDSSNATTPRAQAKRLVEAFLNRIKENEDNKGE